MPAEDVEIEAKFPEYQLTIETPYFTRTENKQEGEVITIEADTTSPFKSWTAEGLSLTTSQKLNPTLTITMPGNNVTITANYQGVNTITTIEDEGSNITGIYTNYRCSECGGTDHECEVINITIEAEHAEVVEGDAGLNTITIIQGEGANVTGDYDNHKCSICGGTDHQCEVVNIFI